ncbi:MAG TPA: helix-turn-helix domain-containing protein [Solirubrobacteraceae bacterium]|jgi:AcrR family transcriptional regulator|nr:helix-turn-helix domain-containing protein [Solirubrobacteraceae bacterium]
MSPRPPAARSASPRVQLRGERSRAEILDAAERLMADAGFASVSIAQIEQASGLPASSIYWHFDSKAGLLLEIMRRGAERFLADVPEMDAIPGPALERARAIFVTAAEHVGEHPLFLRLMLGMSLQSGGAGETARQVIREVRDQMLARLRVTIAAIAQEAGVTSDDAIDQAARATRATLDGGFLAIQLGEDFDLKRMAPRMPEVVLGFLGHPRR